jgi:hypothetical protein
VAAAGLSIQHLAATEVGCSKELSG